MLGVSRRDLRDVPGQVCSRGLQPAFSSNKTLHSAAIQTRAESPRLHTRMRHVRLGADQSLCESHSIDLRSSARHDSDLFLKQNRASPVAKLNVMIAGPHVEFLEMAGEAKVSAIKVDAGL